AGRRTRRGPGHRTTRCDRSGPGCRETPPHRSPLEPTLGGQSPQFLKSALLHRSPSPVILINRPPPVDQRTRARNVPALACRAARSHKSSNNRATQTNSDGNDWFIEPVRTDAKHNSVLQSATGRRRRRGRIPTEVIEQDKREGRAVPKCTCELRGGRPSASSSAIELSLAEGADRRIGEGERWSVSSCSARTLGNSAGCSTGRLTWGHFCLRRCALRGIWIVPRRGPAADQERARRRTDDGSGMEPEGDRRERREIVRQDKKSPHVRWKSPWRRAKS